MSQLNSLRSTSHHLVNTPRPSFPIRISYTPLNNFHIPAIRRRTVENAGRCRRRCRRGRMRISGLSSLASAPPSADQPESRAGRGRTCTFPSIPISEQVQTVTPGLSCTQTSKPSHSQPPSERHQRPAVHVRIRVRAPRAAPGGVAAEMEDVPLIVGAADADQAVAASPRQVGIGT